jgi:5'-nucleotidase
MCPSESSRLVVGISSRALFDLRKENLVFESQGLEAFRAYQRDHERELLLPGGAFPLVRALLDLNAHPSQPVVDVVLMSRNHPDITPRILNAIAHHQLSIKRAALTGGQPIAPYLEPYGVNLLLSADRRDVQSAIDAGFAAGLIYNLPPDVNIHLDEIRFAFDGDGVLFSDEADRVYRERGLDAYFEYERENAKRPLPDGPFAPILRLIHSLQSAYPPGLQTRVALVTARNVQAHERVLRTLEAWDVRLDEGHFVGKTPKEGILRVFRPHIFFDDRAEVCRRAAAKVPTAQVLLPTEPVSIHNMPNSQLTLVDETRKNRFLVVCRGYLRKEFGSKEPEFAQWYFQNLSSWPSEHADRFLDELAVSAGNTPPGEQRRAAGPANNRTAKLLGFMDQLARKHRPTQS